MWRRASTVTVTSVVDQALGCVLYEMATLKHAFDAQVIYDYYCIIIIIIINTFMINIIIIIPTTFMIIIT
jgi:hypothetical protein